MAKTYNERAGAEFEAAFTDADRNIVAPTTVHHKLLCLTTDETVINWTADNILTDTDDLGNITRYYVSIVIPGSANAIQKSSNRQEQKQLIVVADKDLAGEYSETYTYYVTKVRGRT
jgi:hypothetical protein